MKQTKQYPSVKRLGPAAWANYPSEEKHGNKVEKKSARQCSCHPQNWINEKGCGVNIWQVFLGKG